MEYGVFSQSSYNWWLIGGAIVSLLASGLCAFNVFKSSTAHKGKFALFQKRVSPKNGALWVWGAIAIGAFIAAGPLLAVGLSKDNVTVSDECYFQNYAGEGIYEVVDAKLAFLYDASYIPVKADDPRVTGGEYGYFKNSASQGFLTDKTNKYYIRIFTPKKPAYYEVRLGGRGDPSNPSSFRIVRCVQIPYDDVAENNKFTPIAQITQGIFSPPHIPVEAANFMMKYGDKWWQFADESPPKNEIPKSPK